MCLYPTVQASVSSILPQFPIVKGRMPETKTLSELLGMPTTLTTLALLLCFYKYLALLLCFYKYLIYSIIEQKTSQKQTEKQIQQSALKLENHSDLICRHMHDFCAVVV